MTKDILLILLLLTIACSNPTSNQDPTLVGDINANELPYEVADAVLYSNYFIYGEAVFNQNYKTTQIRNSDVNQNGNRLTVADLQYLIRVVVGDAGPVKYHSLFKEKIPIIVSERWDIIRIEGYVQAGAVYMIVGGNQTPRLLVNNMEMIYNYDGTNTNIVIFPTIESSSIFSLDGDFLKIDGSLLYIEIATPLGQETTVTLNEY